MSVRRDIIAHLLSQPKVSRTVSAIASAIGASTQAVEVECGIMYRHGSLTLHKQNGYAPAFVLVQLAAVVQPDMLVDSIVAALDAVEIDGVR